MISNVIQCVMSSFLPPPQDRLAAPCQRWKIRELSLFGSAARGDARADSDIGLLVEFEPDADWSLLDTARSVASSANSSDVPSISCASATSPTPIGSPQFIVAGASFMPS